MSQAQGIEAEIPQERYGRSEELERIARSGTCAGCAQINMAHRVGIRAACCALRLNYKFFSGGILNLLFVDIGKKNVIP
jgi:hypothetical protein